MKYSKIHKIQKFCDKSIIVDIPDAHLWSTESKEDDAATQGGHLRRKGESTWQIFANGCDPPGAVIFAWPILS